MRRSAGGRRRRHRDPGVAQLLLQHRDAGGVVAVLALCDRDPRIEVGGFSAGGRAAEIAADRADIFGIGLGEFRAVGGALGGSHARRRNGGLHPRSGKASALPATARRGTRRGGKRYKRQKTKSPELRHAILPRRRTLLQLLVNRYGRRRMSGELSGHVAIVTGGASGIGAASAALLADQG